MEEKKELKYTVKTHIVSNADLAKTHEGLNKIIVDNNLLSRDIINYTVHHDGNMWVGTLTATNEAEVITAMMMMQQQKVAFENKLKL